MPTEFLLGMARVNDNSMRLGKFMKTFLKMKSGKICALFTEVFGFYRALAH